VVHETVKKELLEREWRGKLFLASGGGGQRPEKEGELKLDAKETW